MNVEYALKRSTRARTMRLVVHPDSRVVVTAPASFGLGSIERFVAKHSAWVQRKVAETAGRKVIYARRSQVVALKQRALALASARCAHFAKHYGVRYNKITVRAQKFRWGSCSQAGSLNFNYKIAVLPSHLADYIIVHELCHLAEMNHSKRFWELVGRTVPMQKAHRKELRNTVVVFS